MVTVARRIQNNATPAQMVMAINALVASASTPSSPVFFPNGLINAPGWAFQGDHGVGAYLIAANDGALVANGNRVLRWTYDSTFGPRVGIGGTFVQDAGLHVSKTETGKFLALFQQQGLSSGDKGVQISIVDNHAATAVLEALYSTSSIGFRVWGDGGVVVGPSVSPGAASLQVDTALSVGVTPSFPLHVFKTKTGSFVATLEQTGSASGDGGLDVRIANTAQATTLVRAVSNSITRFEVRGDGSVLVGAATAQGAGTLSFIPQTGQLFFSATRKKFGYKSGSIGAGAAALQLFPAASGGPTNPGGYLKIRGDDGYNALYACEGGNTRRVDGDALQWGAGGTAAVASVSNVYVTGGVLTIKNNTVAARTYEMTFEGT